MNDDQLDAALRALPREVAPRRDLWVSIEPNLAPRRSWWGFRTVAVGTALMAAVCAAMVLLPRGAPDVESAAQALREGDLASAQVQYAAMLEDYPDDPAVVTGSAYMALLQGDGGRADALLAELPVTPENELRRALVALRVGDRAGVQIHGTQSGVPSGLVLAAEAHIADGDFAVAKPLLVRASKDGGPIGSVAGEYLARLGSDDPFDLELVRAYAMWASGDRAMAVDLADDALMTAAGRDDEKLLWAGRAVTTASPNEAERLLDAIGAPPEGQAWRVHATYAIVAAARGDIPTASSTFAMLEIAGAPISGVEAARATAAGLVSEPADAEILLGGLKGEAAARALWGVGSPAAFSAVPDGSTFGRFITGR